MSESGSQEEYAGALAGRKMITVALMLAMAVSALEQTVVSTAMPSIIAQLKGLDIYPWVFSAYLLAATVTTPIYGKLADLLGRKRVLLFGLTVFTLGSVLSGCSRSMGQLIAARVIQGLGAGAVMPIIITLIGDLFTLQERAKVQGLFSAVWGGSSLIGPALGGVLTDQLSWRWVFFVTVPFAVLSAWLLAMYVDEKFDHHKVSSIDWPGVLLLAAGATMLLLAVLSAPTHSAAWVGVTLILAVALLVLLVRWEWRAVEPVLPIDLMAEPHIAAAILGSFLVGGLLLGIDTYVPLFIQGVRGGTATAAGRVITPLFVCWSVSVAVAAKVVVRLGFRRTAVIGSLLLSSGVLSLVLGTLWPEASGPFFLAGNVVVGLGMGPTSLSYILGVQNVVKWGQRGAATSAVIFFRTMGGALVVGMLGAVLGWELTRLLAAAPQKIDVAAALRPETHKLLSPSQLRIVQEVLGRSLLGVFLLMFAMALLVIVCSVGLKGGRADAPREEDQQPGHEDESIGLTVGLKT
jgi:MFS family permease